MSRTRVKICGITRNEDALLAAQLGADAIGLNFYPGSPRVVTPVQARTILADLPGFVSVVGLFVNPTAIEVEKVLATVRVDCLQFHGEEDPAFCLGFGLPVLKAIRVSDRDSAKRQLDRYSGMTNLLLDSFDKSTAGGTGKSFDWQIAAETVGSSSASIILAGGLDAENVAAAISRVRPYGVDVSSGVEQAPGIKDPDRMHGFFAAVEAADRGLNSNEQ